MSYPTSNNVAPMPQLPKAKGIVHKTELDRFCQACRNMLTVNFNKINYDHKKGEVLHNFKAIHHETLKDFQAAVATDCPTCAFAYSRLFPPRISEAAIQHYLSSASSFKVWADIETYQYVLTIHCTFGPSPLIPGAEDTDKTSIEFRLSKIDVDPVPPQLIPDLDPFCTGSIDLRSWLAHCSQTHDCMNDMQPDYLPPRLLDCSGAQLRLVDGSTILQSGKARQYAALSHCWGKSLTHFQLTTNNIESCYKEIDFAALPRTFRDAVTTVRRADVDYLWIDSLCIIQQGVRHVPDWQYHITEMASIYSNCHFNITAAHSSDPNGGCFSTRPAAFPGVCFLQPSSSSTSSPDRLGLISIAAANYGHIWKLPISSRAWAFQERLLSRRLVQYTEHDVFWECRGCSLSGSLYQGRDNRFSRGYHSLLPTNGGFHGISALPVFHWEAPEHHDPLTLQKNNREHWQWTAEWYSKLAITRTEDTLPAIAAIAQRLNEKHFTDEYVAGFFKSHLPEALYFERSTSHPRGAYVAPSWSWAARRGAFSFHEYLTFDSKATRMTKILQVDADPVDAKNMYGQLRSASLTVRSLIFTLPFDASQWDSSSPSTYHLGAERLAMTEVGKNSWGLENKINYYITWDDDQVAKPAELVFLCICRNFGLLIRPRESESQGGFPRFERVGSWFIGGQELWRLLVFLHKRIAKKKTVVLV